MHIIVYSPRSSWGRMYNHVYNLYKMAQLFLLSNMLIKLCINMLIKLCVNIRPNWSIIYNYYMYRVCIILKVYEMGR